MEHIQNEFDERIKYVCISSHEDTPTSHHHRLIYIQIILKKRVNKKTYFLEAVSGSNYRNFIHVFMLFSYSNNIYVLLILGMRCNYLVTTDDSAWNVFLKKGLLYTSSNTFH